MATTPANIPSARHDGLVWQTPTPEPIPTVNKHTASGAGMDVDMNPDNTVFGGAYTVRNIELVGGVVKEATLNHTASDSHQAQCGPKFFASLRKALEGAVPLGVGIDPHDCNTWDPERFPAENRSAYIIFPFIYSHQTCYKCRSGFFPHPENPNYPGSVLPFSQMMADEATRRTCWLCPPTARATPQELVAMISAVTTECRTCALETFSASAETVHWWNIRGKPQKGKCDWPGCPK